MRTALATASLLALALAAPAAALECDATGEWRIVMKERPEGAGYDTLVHAGADTPCAWEPTSAVLVLADPADVLYPLAIDGGYLVLDAGTGPDRSLVAYRLDDGEKVLSTLYEDNEGVTFRPDGFAFFMASAERATPANCPDHDGMTGMGFTPALFEGVTFRYASGTLERSGARICSAAQ